jgi:hypothetical protein
MKKNAWELKPWIKGLTICLCLFTQPTLGQIHSELSSKESEAVAKGTEVIKILEKPESTWPEIRVYKTLKAKPETVASTFLDYETAPSYIPNLKEAKILREHTKDIKDVQYIVKLPLLFTLKYIVQNKYEKTKEGHIIRWNLIRSAFTKSIEGSLRIEPHQTGSIVCYANLIEPSSRLLTKLKGQAIIEASNTIEAIKKETERREKLTVKLR